jgi:DNA (cytosine-5)-methyltransferase 1
MTLRLQRRAADLVHSLVHDAPAQVGEAAWLLGSDPLSRGLTPAVLHPRTLAVTGGHGRTQTAGNPSGDAGSRCGHGRSPGDTGGHGRSPADTPSPGDLVHSLVQRPRLLDLFCGAGGCSVGYARAGFDVVGVDHRPQPDYPYSFVLADALTYPLDGFDVIHASPPCKRWAITQAVHRHRLRLFDPNDDLLTPTLERLRAGGLPWIVENVPGAPMPDDAVTLCGSAFGLAVRRHRLFAASVPLVGSLCQHSLQARVVGVYGDGGAWTRTAPGGGGTKVVGADAAAALGIDWTTDQTRLSQAIPPAYAEWIGQQVMTWLR